MNYLASTLALTADTVKEPGVLFVALMGIAIVMIGLTCLILLCVLMSKVYQLLAKDGEKKAASPKDTSLVAVPSVSATIPNKGELVAAISVALAEEIGADISAIRIHSIRRVGGISPAPSPAHGELVAAISAAVAEEIGTDISAIRIHSIRRVG